jgi:hypothetical protein
VWFGCTSHTVGLVGRVRGSGQARGDNGIRTGDKGRTKTKRIRSASPGSWRERPRPCRRVLRSLGAQCLTSEVRIKRGAIVLVVLLFACASCSQAHTEANSPHSTRPHITTTTHASNTTITTNPVTATTFPVFGTRTFTVSGVLLSGGNWLTVGLHPTTTPVQLHASGATPLEVCPAGLDGGLNDSSWPPWFKFRSCMKLSPSAMTTLPATDGETHVAFAVKEISPGPLSPLEVSVTYNATDSFVELIPPATTSQIYMTVSYAPLSATTGATATPINLLTPAPGYSLDVMEAGRALTQMVPCDFPTELTSCFGGVTPGQPVAVQLVGRGGPVVLNLAWK